MAAGILSEATHRAVRPARHGRTTEAEIRAIPDEAVRPPERVKLASELAASGRRFGRVDPDITRGTAPAGPVPMPPRRSLLRASRKANVDVTRPGSSCLAASAGASDLL